MPGPPIRQGMDIKIAKNKKYRMLKNTLTCSYINGSGFCTAKSAVHAVCKTFLDAERLINIHTARTNERTATSLIMPDE
jgi:hypothetical protein